MRYIDGFWRARLVGFVVTLPFRFFSRAWCYVMLWSKRSSSSVRTMKYEVDGKCTPSLTLSHIPRT